MLTRRNFLRRLFRTSLLAGVATYTFPSPLRAAPSFDDYKALVVINLAGGNDGLNTFIPLGDAAGTGYDTYATIRTTLRVSNAELTLSRDGNGRLALGGGASNPYYRNDDLTEAYLKGVYPHASLGVGTNGLMPEVADLVDRGKVAIIANCGNLIEPATKSQLTDRAKPKPPFLFAHDHQTKLLFNGEASELNRLGWAGRLYDQWKGVNGNSLYGMNISLAGVSHLLYGDQTDPLLMKPGGPASFGHIARQMYDDLLDLSRSDDFRRLYNAMRRRAFAMQDQMVGDWETLQPDFSGEVDAYGQALFSIPDARTLGEKSTDITETNLVRQLEAVVRLAHIGRQLGIKRQIFYVKQGGYDTHSNQTSTHASRLRGLSLAVGKFYRALEALNMENSVTAFSISEFGRSTGNNGDGTDHAWGSHHFVVGGAVQGGLYGPLPDLTLGGDQDISRKGRIIPTVSFTQYYATLVKWFGADDATLNVVFPELQNFSGASLGTDMGFMAV